MNHLRLALTLLPLAAASLAAQDWPGFRGPHRNGVANGAKPPLEWSDTENLAWKLDLPGPGSSSPIVADGRVYVTCYTGYGDYLEDGGDPKELQHHLVCVDSKTGKKIWTKSIPGPLEKAARQVQIKEHGFASPTPVTDGKAVYAYFGRAGVVAFDLQGKVLWQRDLGKPSKDAAAPTNSVKRRGKALSLRWGTAASPLLHDGLVIVNCSEQSNSIRALDQKTGKLVWNYESANLEGCATSPVVVGSDEDQVVVIVLAGDVWALSPKTGKLVWSVETGSRGGMSPTPVADANYLYTFGGSGLSHALRLNATKEEERVLWKSKNQDIPSPVLHDGILFLVRQNGIAVALSAKDGKPLFDKTRLEGRTGKVYASPVVADGKLYVVSRKRGTFVYSADAKLKLLARNQLEDDKTQFNASPAILGDRIFLRSDRCLYCIKANDPPK